MCQQHPFTAKHPAEKQQNISFLKILKKSLSSHFCITYTVNENYKSKISLGGARYRASQFWSALSPPPGAGRHGQNGSHAHAHHPHQSHRMSTVTTPGDPRLGIAVQARQRLRSRSSWPPSPVGLGQQCEACGATGIWSIPNHTASGVIFSWFFV